MDVSLVTLDRRSRVRALDWQVK